MLRYTRASRNITQPCCCIARIPGIGDFGCKMMQLCCAIVALANRPLSSVSKRWYEAQSTLLFCCRSRSKKCPTLSSLACLPTSRGSRETPISTRQRPRSHVRHCRRIPGSPHRTRGHWPSFRCVVIGSPGLLLGCHRFMVRGRSV